MTSKLMALAPTTPGVYYGLDNDAYHAGTHAVSNSMLRSFAQSPLHCFARHLDPDRPARKVKGGQLEGSLAHCATLEPHAFAVRYPVGPEVNRNTKVWKDFAESHPGLDCIQPNQATTAKAQARSIRAIPDIGTMLSSGRPEVSAYWIDEATGLLCRCRPDHVWPHPDGESVMLLDVKTYSDASPAEFARQVARKSYHGQAAHYSDGYAKASGKTVLGFVFVAVETEFPYAAASCTLDEQSIEKGRADNRILLDGYAQCQRLGMWPGYAQTIEIITLPKWAQ
jgi:hypothetical protein